MNTMPNITVILTKLEDMVIGIETRWALLERINAEQKEERREKEEWVEGYEMGDEKRQDM